MDKKRMKKGKLRKSTRTAIILIVGLIALLIFMAVNSEWMLLHILIVYIMGGSYLWCAMVGMEKMDEESKAREARKRGLDSHYELWRENRDAPKQPPD
jgi:fatty acid desaturase